MTDINTVLISNLRTAVVSHLVTLGPPVNTHNPAHTIYCLFVFLFAISYKYTLPDKIQSDCLLINNVAWSTGTTKLTEG